MAGDTCDVCGKSPTVGVAASCLGAFSLAYCADCIREGAEPYDMVVATLAMCNGRENAADWTKPVVEATLKVANKTIEELDGDVARQIEEDEKMYIMYDEMWEQIESDEDEDDLNDIFDPEEH